MFIGKGLFEKLLLEIKQSVLDDSDIETSISDLNKRPFYNLFKGKGDRFLVKIYNKEFIDVTNNLGLDYEKFNIEDGYYNAPAWAAGPKVRYGYLIKVLRQPGSPFNERDIIKLKHMLQQRNVFSYALFSRHPMDVIRMSDVGGIESCHSPNKGHFYCAQVESKNSGGIVFELDARSARWVKDHLDIKDIFDDDDREIKGINPLSRVRLRRLVDIEKDTDYAIPEQRYYSPEGNSYGYKGAFATKVLEYCRENQKLPDIKDINTDGYVDKNFVFVGGHYTDTEMEKLVSSLLGIDFEFKRRINKSDSIESSLNYILRYPSRLNSISIGDLTRIIQSIEISSDNYNYDQISRILRTASYKISDPDKKLDFYLYQYLTEAAAWLAEKFYYYYKSELSPAEKNLVYYIMSKQFVLDEFKTIDKIRSSPKFSMDIFKNYGLNIAINCKNALSSNIIYMIGFIHKEKSLEDATEELEDILRERIKNDNMNYEKVIRISNELKGVSYWENRFDRCVSFLKFCLDFFIFAIKTYSFGGYRDKEVNNTKLAFKETLSILISGSSGSFNKSDVLRFKTPRTSKLIDFFDEEYK